MTDVIHFVLAMLAISAHPTVDLPPGTYLSGQVVLSPVYRETAVYAPRFDRMLVGMQVKVQLGGEFVQGILMPRVAGVDAPYFTVGHEQWQVYSDPSGYAGWPVSSKSYKDLPPPPPF